MNRLLPALLITGLLAACGQKGALYLPPPAPGMTPAPAPAPSTVPAAPAPAQPSAPVSP